MVSKNNFGENQINDIVKNFNQKNKKEDEDRISMMPYAINKENNINNITSSDKKQIIYLKNKLKLMKKKLKKRDSIIKKIEKKYKKLEILYKKLEKENEKLKEENNKYNDYKNKYNYIKPKIANKTEIYNHHYENININIFLDNSQQNYKYNKYNNMIKNSKKNNFLFNANQNKMNEYSFKCLSDNDDLTKIIFEESEDIVEFKLLLMNTGPLPWPKDLTKLVFDNPLFDQENSQDIILVAQEKNEIKNYLVRFKNLKEYPRGEYTSKLRFNVNGKNIGEKIVLTIIIEEKYDISELKKEGGGNTNQLTQFYEGIYGAYHN